MLRPLYWFLTHQLRMYIISKHRNPYCTVLLPRRRLYQRHKNISAIAVPANKRSNIAAKRVEQNQSHTIYKRLESRTARHFALVGDTIRSVPCNTYKNQENKQSVPRINGCKKHKSIFTYIEINLNMPSDMAVLQPWGATWKALRCKFNWTRWEIKKGIPDRKPPH